MNRSGKYIMALLENVWLGMLIGSDNFNLDNRHYSPTYTHGLLLGLV